VQDNNYQGSASGTLTISKANATVTLVNLNQTYDGTAKSASATTIPANLNVTFTYNGSAAAPINAGTYIVVGTVQDNNYQGSASGTLTIGKASLTVTPDGGKSKLLGSTFTAFTGNVSGLQHGDTVTVNYISTGAPASAVVGTYDITVGTVTFTSGSASNYSIVQNTAVKGLTVSYRACLLYDPTRAVKSGATYPIKLYLCDVNSVDVSSPGVVLNATGISQISGFTGGVEDAGSANPDSNFRYDSTLGPSGGYIFNLKTSGLNTGSYTLTFTAGGSSSSTYSVAFGVK
jgi:hypothetical protein